MFEAIWDVSHLDHELGRRPASSQRAGLPSPVPDGIQRPRDITGALLEEFRLSFLRDPAQADAWGSAVRRYLQAVWRNGEVRYSFVNIFYNARRRRYEVAGRTYSPAGEKLNDFNSTYVLFPSSKDADIEFIWRARNASRGYTRMTLEGFQGGLHSGRRARHYIQLPGPEPIRSVSSISMIITSATRLACVHPQHRARSRTSSRNSTRHSART